MGEKGQKVQISSCNTNKSWGCNVKRGDMVNSAVLHIRKQLGELPS